MSGPSDKPKEAVQPRWGLCIETFVLMLMYLALNSALNIMNRYALGIYGFTFPILLTICHMMFAFILLLPFMMVSKDFNPRKTLSKQYKGLLCIGVFAALNISLNNLSLVHISLSLNQVIRASMPVVVAAVAVFVEKKVPTRIELIALLTLTSGVIISVFEGKASGNTFGISLSITGVLCAAAMMSTTGKILSEKLDVLQLAFYTTPISSCVLLPFFWFLEKDQFMVYAQDNGAAVLAIVAAGSIVAFLYNVTHNTLMKRTSSVAVTVLGEIKIVGLLLLSAAVLPGESSQFTARMTAGCVLAMLGFCLYTHAKMAASRKTAAAAAATQKAAHEDRMDIEEGQPLLKEEGRRQRQQQQQQQQQQHGQQEKQQAVIEVLPQAVLPKGKEFNGNAKLWATDGQMRVVANVQANAAGGYNAPQPVH